MDPCWIIKGIRMWIKKPCACLTSVLKGDFTASLASGSGLYGRHFKVPNSHEVTSHMRFHMRGSQA